MKPLFVLVTYEDFDNGFLNCEVFNTLEEARDRMSTLYNEGLERDGVDKDGSILYNDYAYLYQDNSMMRFEILKREIGKEEIDMTI